MESNELASVLIYDGGHYQHRLRLTAEANGEYRIDSPTDPAVRLRWRTTPCGFEYANVITEAGSPGCPPDEFLRKHLCFCREVYPKLNLDVFEAACLATL